MITWTLIELESYEGAYDMPYNMLIAKKNDGQRYLLAEGFGGMDSLRGGAYRWRHGSVIKLLTTDTLETLCASTEDGSIIMRALMGYDIERPLLAWRGSAIEGVVQHKLSL